MKISKKWKVEKVGDFWRIISVNGNEPKWAEEFANRFTSVLSALEYGREKMGVSLAF